MVDVENQLIEQLKDVGDRLLQPPSSTPELLNLLEELELFLSKVGQSPPQPVHEALRPSMKALISDDLLRNSDADVKITVASCLNEMMRISAPVAPYDDEKMKEIFELIVSSFDKLSSQSGQCYSKAVLILENVARLQSCVMMLDLDCDPLIVKMFELFQKNISSDHPHSVFLAMKTIMSLVIKESDAVSLELLKVLLASIRKEKQNDLPTSLKLGAKIFEECAEKLKPFIITTVNSLGCCLEDYAPILSLICKKEPDTVKDHVDNSAKHVVYNELPADKSHAIEVVQCLMAIQHYSQNAGAKTDSKALADSDTESGGTASKRRRKANSHNPDEASGNRFGKGQASLESPRGRLTKSSLASNGEEKAMPALEDQVNRLGDSSKKKGRLPKKDASGGSGSKTTIGASGKDKSQINDASKSQRKRASLDDDVIETPYGRKSYKEDLVGSRIKVWWPLDHKYYEGLITSFDAATKKHKVDYDDGDEEVLNLRKERWEFIGEETIDDLELLAFTQTPQPPSHMSQREGSIEDEKEESQNHTCETGSVPDSGVESDEGSHQVTMTQEKVNTPEVVSETKRPRLSDGQNS